MSILWSEDRFDEDQFDRLAEYLASGRFYRRYSAPHELIGIGRSKLRGAVIRRQWAKPCQVDPRRALASDN